MTCWTRSKSRTCRARHEAAINPNWENYRKRLAIKVEKKPEVLTSNWLRVASLPGHNPLLLPAGSRSISN